MFRYVALTWNGSDESQATLARRIAQYFRAGPHRWIDTLQAPGVLVLHAGERAGCTEARLLPDDRGVVVGTLFRKGVDAPGKFSIDREEAAAIVLSGGRRLPERYWGRYVAFVRDATSRQIWVLRGCTGGLPCFSTGIQGVTVFFSDIQDCMALRSLMRFTVDWDYIRSHTCQPLVQLTSSATGLEGVTQVRPGECIELHDGMIRATHQYWSAADVARSDPIEDFEVAVAELRRETDTCVAAWASCHPNVIHFLSGGLDSSIVLNCLHRATPRPRVTCLNYFDSSSDSDERRYAKLMADSTGYELLACEDLAANVRLESILDISRSALPQAYLHSVQHSKAQGELAHARQATAMFTGIGGDQIFYQGPVELGAADFAFMHGMRGRFFSMALDIARRRRASVWSVMGGAIRRGLLSPARAPSQDLDLGTTLVSADLIASQAPQNAAIYERLGIRKGMPPGKGMHALYVASACADVYYDPLGAEDYPERVHPLVSQPLLELVLRIPTYVLTSGGLDRAVARRAYRDELPRQVVVRQAKGGDDANLRQLLRGNVKFLRELMLNGLLVKERVLDRRRLENALTLQRGGLSAEAGELLVQHLSTEAWLQGWPERSQRAAA